MVTDYHVDEYPTKSQAALDAFLAITPEQQQQQYSYKIHELGYTGHSLNLKVDDC